VHHLADTKFEFGLLHDELIWIDEALTPDSSRFWPRHYSPAAPVLFRQTVCSRLSRAHAVAKNPAGPELSPERDMAVTFRAGKSAAALHEAGKHDGLPADLAATRLRPPTLADNQKKGRRGHEI